MCCLKQGHEGALWRVGAERGTRREGEEQRVSTSFVEETGWETVAVGKLKVWEPQEES